MIEALGHVLGNTCRIGRTSVSFGWNAAGPGAADAHRCFCAQGNALHDSLHAMALHIRGLGHIAVLDYSDLNVVVNPPTGKTLPSLEQMGSVLRKAHSEACLSIQAATDIAEERSDYSTLHILSTHLALHRRHIWELETLGFGKTE